MFLRGVDCHGVGPATERRNAPGVAVPPCRCGSRRRLSSIPDVNVDKIRGILAPFSPAPSTGDPVFAFFPARGDSWGKPVYFDIPNGRIAEAVAVADFNGDGRPDFAGVDDNHDLPVFLDTTTKDTCAFPSHIGVRMCSPDSDGYSDDTARTTRIHASSNGGALPIIGMKALIDGKLVFESDVNTLDASVTVGAGRHVLTVSASDRNGNVYQSTVGFHVR